MRSLFIILVGLAAISAHASPPVTLPILDESAEKFDMMVTGVSLTKEQKDRWVENRKKFLDCPECALEQPFPGGLELSED